MADIANKAEELADEARAHVEQGVDAVADTAQDAVDAVSETASTGAEMVTERAEEVKRAVTETAQQLDTDDRRILVVAVIAGITLTVTLLIRRSRRR